MPSSLLEGGKAEFKCERSENKAEEQKSKTIEDIGAKETGKSDLLAYKDVN